MSDTRGDPNRVVSRSLVNERRVVGPELAGSLEAEPNESFWTAERMAKATPVRIEADPGPSALAEPGPLAEFAESAAVRKQDSQWPRGTLEAPLAPGSIPGGFETSRVRDYTRAPYLAIGRMFMAFGRELKTATAWVVGERAILTAGHCIYDPDTVAKWASNVMFVPRLRDTDEPAGRWNAISIHTLAGWQGARDYGFDLAGAVLDAPVQPATGSIGWVANQPDPGPYQSVGYPAEWLSATHAFDGKEMWRCNGRQVSAAQMANNMTKGSSGGPWLVRKSGKIYAVGLNSYRLTAGETGKMRSPAFGQGFLNLISAIDG
jgi:V8-like Glu-specific endopeptidase